MLKIWSFNQLDDWLEHDDSATSFEHADAPELEVYPPGNSASEDYRCEVWVPIVKK